MTYGLKVTDFESAEEFGSLLIQASLEFWRERHWYDEQKNIEPVVNSLIDALQSAKALQAQHTQR